MTISVFYAEAEPGDGYVEPFPVAYYFDFPHTMTVLRSKDPLVVGFLGGGGKIEPHVAPEIVPPALPDLLPFQFWAMVDISGKRPALEGFAASLPGNQKIVAQAKLQHTLSFRRDNPLVEAARQGIGLTNEELDALWVQAAAIV